MNTNTRSILSLSLLAFMSVPLVACNSAATPGAPAPQMSPADTSSASAKPRRAAAAPAPAPHCYDCGKVASIEALKHKGKATGTGAVLGAIVGGVIGHQFGSGKGNTAATAGGAVVGGVAGHQIEREVKAETYYHILVLMDDGGTRSVDVDQLNGLTVGTKVKLVGNTLQIS